MSLERQQELEERYVMHTFGRKPVEFVRGAGMVLEDDKEMCIRDSCRLRKISCFGSSFLPSFLRLGLHSPCIWSIFSYLVIRLVQYGYFTFCQPLWM